MKNALIFLLFITYTTSIFFVPNSLFLVIFFIINLIIAIILKINFKKMLSNILKIFPFILFTFIINCFLDYYINAMWISIKLLLVCNITYLYSRTIRISQFADTIKLLCSPLKLLKINTDEIKILVCVSLSMIPVLKRELFELKDSCKAKGIDFNIKNMKLILSKFFVSLLNRVNQIDESLKEKGYYF